MKEMQMPRKSFGVAIAADPISFDIECPVRGARNFHCRDRLSAGTLMKFAEMFSSIEDESEGGPTNASAGAEAIPAIKDFFNSVLMPEGRSLFWEIIYDSEEAIPLDTLVEIAGWLAEVYSGDRPTGPTSSGTSAGTSTGDGSPGSPSQLGTPTYSRSDPTPALT
jgi:hypothetical protein